MSHAENQCPCLGCHLSAAIEEWTDEMVATGDPEYIKQANNTAYILEAVGTLAAEIIFLSAKPEDYGILLEQVGRMMRDHIAEQGGDRRSTHGAPATVQ